MSDDRVSKQRPRGDAGEEPDADAGQVHAGERKAELDAEVDAILDDIDEVLEENAEEFVASFVQKGGQ